MKITSNINLQVLCKNDFQALRKFSDDLKNENINFSVNKLKLDRIIEDSSQLMFLAKSNIGEIIGLISATKKNDLDINTRWLELFVSLKSRNKGIGNKLLQTLIFECNQIDSISRLYLSVMKNNSQAIHLYKAHGFKSENKILHFYTPWISMQNYL